MSDENDNILGPVIDAFSADKYISSKEYDECILKIGSFLSIIHSKKLSPLQLYIHIAENQIMQQVIFEILGLDTFEQFTREYALRYPIIYKSKLIINKLSGKNVRTNRKTKKSV